MCCCMRMAALSCNPLIRHPWRVGAVLWPVGGRLHRFLALTCQPAPIVPTLPRSCRVRVPPWFHRVACSATLRPAWCCQKCMCALRAPQVGEYFHTPGSKIGRVVHLLALLRPDPSARAMLPCPVVIAQRRPVGRLHLCAIATKDRVASGEAVGGSIGVGRSRLARDKQPPRRARHDELERAGSR